MYTLSFYSLVIHVVRYQGCHLCSAVRIVTYQITSLSNESCTMLLFKNTPSSLYKCVKETNTETLIH